MYHGQTSLIVDDRVMCHRHHVVAAVVTAIAEHVCQVHALKHQVELMEH